MRHLDTSLLVDAFTGERRSAPMLAAWLAGGNRIGISSLVLYEFFRGPRTAGEKKDVEELLTTSEVIDFRRNEAERAADIYRALKQPRHREIDIAIAACALVREASIWTLNPRDFRDIPDLDVV